MGGLNVLLMIKELVDGLIIVIGFLDELKNGGFLDYIGKILFW